MKIRTLNTMFLVKVKGYYGDDLGVVQLPNPPVKGDFIRIENSDLLITKVIYTPNSANQFEIETE